MSINITYPTSDRELSDVIKVLTKANIEDDLSEKPMLILGCGPYNNNKCHIGRGFNAPWISMVEFMEGYNEEDTISIQGQKEIEGTIKEDGEIFTTSQDYKPDYTIDIDSSFSMILIDCNSISYSAYDRTKRILGKVSVPIYYFQHSKLRDYQRNMIDLYGEYRSGSLPDVAGGSSLTFYSEGYTIKNEETGLNSYNTITVVKKLGSK